MFVDESYTENEKNKNNESFNFNFSLENVHTNFD